MAFPATTSLAAYWKLDEASGTRNDSIGTNHLTDVNTVGSATGKISTAASFVAANVECLSIASNSNLQGGGDVDLCIAAWVNPTLLAGTHRIIVAKHDASAYATSEYFLEWNKDSAGGTGRFQWTCVWNTAGSQTSVDATSLGVVSLSTWYFVVAWHDAAASTLNIQVNNGTVDSTAMVAGGLNSSSTVFRIGTNAISGDCWEGLIDEVSLWRRVLTSTERTDLYNSGAGITLPVTTSVPQAMRSYRQRRV